MQASGTVLVISFISPQVFGLQRQLQKKRNFWKDFVCKYVRKWQKTSILCALVQIFRNLSDVIRVKDMGKQVDLALQKW